MDAEELDELAQDNITTNNHHQFHSSSEKQLFTIYTEIVTVLIVINICVDIFIIHLIRRFKKLRLSTQNWYIMHISLVNCINLSTTLLHRILMQFDIIHSHVIAIYVQIILIATQLCFLTLLLIDWLLATYSTNNSLRFRKCKTVVVTLIYILYLSCSISFCFLRYVTNMLLTTLFSLLLGYSLLLIFVVVIHIMHCVKRKGVAIDVLLKNTTALRFGTVGILIWLPFVVFLFLSFTIADAYLFYMALVLGLLIICNPLVNLSILYNYNTDFRGSVIQFLRCDSEYVQNLEDNNPSEVTVVFDAKNGVLQQTTE